VTALTSDGATESVWTLGPVQRRENYETNPNGVSSIVTALTSDGTTESVWTLGPVQRRENYETNPNGVSSIVTTMTSDGATESGWTLGQDQTSRKLRNELSWRLCGTQPHENGVRKIA